MRCERAGADVVLWPAGPLDRTLRPPGSKSLTNRYLACLALAEGASVIRHAAICDDTERMVAGLTALGVWVELDAASQRIRLRGCRGNWPAEQADVDAGSAGTAMRFLTALACTGQGEYRLDGSPRMRARPIRQLVDALRELGAEIGYAGADGCPPLNIAARGLAGGLLTFHEPPSSQYISALLMVAPLARGDVFIDIRGPLVSRPYVEMTLDVLRELGADAVEEGGRFIVPGHQHYRAAEVAVEPDASGATYFWAGAAITGGRARVAGLTRRSRQGDARFVDVLAQMGCRVDEGADWLEVSGPPAGTLRGIDVDLNAMPDTVQTLAVAAVFAQGPTTIRNVANLRIKETDRLAALGAELAKLGATVDVREDGLTITPPARLTSATIDTYDDHRMAMSFAVAGLVLPGLRIREADCVSKSFPSFFDALAGA
jgi:3-phosphoshikimate 1-carboxyvinyltransferase